MKLRFAFVFKLCTDSLLKIDTTVESKILCGKIKLADHS